MMRPSPLEMTVPAHSLEYGLSVNEDLNGTGEGHSPIMNVTVMEKQNYPTPETAKIAERSLGIAKSYYRLFFDVARLKKEGCEKPLRPQDFERAMEDSSDRLLSVCPNHVQGVNASENSNEEVEEGEEEEDSSECSSHLCVHNTLYHTFFPPKLNRQQREVIMRLIIGHSPRPFRNFIWRKVSPQCEFGEEDRFPCEGVSIMIPRASSDMAGLSPVKESYFGWGDGLEAGGKAPFSTSALAESAAEANPPAAHPPLPHSHLHSFFPDASSAFAPGLTGAREASPAPEANPHDARAAEGQTEIEKEAEREGAGGGLPRRGRMLDDSTYTIPPSQQGPAYFAPGVRDSGGKTLVVVMVGLPARGKTFLAQKLCRLLGWQGTRAKVMNVRVAWSYVVRSPARPRTPTPAFAFPSTTASSSSSLSETAPRGPPPLPIATPRFHRNGVFDPHLRDAANDIDDSVCIGSFGVGHRGRAAPQTADPALPREKNAGEPAREDGPRTEPQAYLSVAHFRELLCDPESMERRAYRHVLACFAEDCQEFFSQGGQVVLINDDFITEEMRQEVERLFKPLAEQYMYMEVLRDEGVCRRFNVCKARDSREYPRSFISRKDAMRDFEERTKLLESLYEPLEDDARLAASFSSLSVTQRCYLKVHNSNVIESHGLRGYLASRIVFFAMNLSQMKVQHPIYFVRHGESSYNLENRVGGNPLLTEQGMRDAAALLEFLSSLKTHLRQIDSLRRRYRLRKHRPRAGDSSSPTRDSRARRPRGPFPRAHALELWTSQLQRAIQTAEFGERLLNIRALRWSWLNEIHAGVCEGMTYAEVLAQYPLIEAFRRKSKYTFRYPDGESYQDLVARLEPIILELENAERVVVVVAHQAVLRCLLAYFGSTSAQSSVCLPVPHRTVWRCSYDSKGIASLEELSLEGANVRSPAARQALFPTPPNLTNGEEEEGEGYV